jgi:hypothetical protein
MDAEVELALTGDPDFLCDVVAAEGEGKAGHAATPCLGTGVPRREARGARALKSC